VSDRGAAARTLATVDRRTPTAKKNERRLPAERRKDAVPVAKERRKNTADRRQAERRRQVDPTTCEREYDPGEMEFLRAIEAYKKEFLRPFPTWSEVLEVVKSLGYRQVAEKTPIIQNRAKARALENAQDL
jgi:hypothetical protein